MVIGYVCIFTIFHLRPYLILFIFTDTPSGFGPVMDSRLELDHAFFKRRLSLDDHVFYKFKKELMKYMVLGYVCIFTISCLWPFLLVLFVFTDTPSGFGPVKDSRLELDHAFFVLPERGGWAEHQQPRSHR